MGKHNPRLILIVDDQEAVTNMLRRIFENEGYQVRTVHNGEDGLREASKLIPDLILLDVMMPGLSGFDVLKLLHQNKATANIPVIMITAKDAPSDIEQGLELGADDYIPKPFHPRELIARVRAKIKARILEEALERRTKDLEALLRVSEALNRHLEVSELLSLVLYLVLDLLPGNLAAIYQLDDNEKPIDYRVSHKDGTLDNERFKHQLILDDFLSGRTAIIWPDDPPLINEFPSGMAVALQQGDNVHGVLIITSQEPYDNDHFQLFEGISRQTALALRNAELYAIKARYAEHLEEMVEERTAELKSAHQLLMRSEKLASLGRLAAGIAHEINNPLQPIRIHLEGMLEDLENNTPIDSGDVERTLESVERIGRIVHRFLEFTGKGRSNAPTIEPLDLVTVIENVVALNQSFFSKENVKIITKMGPLPQIHGNRDHMEQVFLNLLINSKAAMPNGGEITISAQSVDNLIEIKVHDTGFGIPEDIIDDIFEPFVSTKEDGTGLGLFISYNIIQNHQGTIEVDSEDGKWTTFTIHLPIQKTNDLFR